MIPLDVTTRKKLTYSGTYTIIVFHFVMCIKFNYVSNNFCVIQESCGDMVLTGRVQKEIVQ